jgi:hypothetical protein
MYTSTNLLRVYIHSDFLVLSLSTESLTENKLSKRARDKLNRYIGKPPKLTEKEIIRERSRAYASRVSTPDSSPSRAASRGGGRSISPPGSRENVRGIITNTPTRGRGESMESCSVSVVSAVSSQTAYSSYSVYPAPTMFTHKCDISV